MPEQDNLSLEFTHPKHVQEDVAWMKFMIAHVYEQVQSERAAVTYHTTEPDLRTHRLVLNQPDALGQADVLQVVGFFSETRGDADMAEAVRHADEELIEDFHQFPNLYSYSSMQIPGGHWANLAIFKDAQARDEWANNDRHLRSVKSLAAKFYRHIRLHSAKLTNQTELELERTKFFAYTDDLVWRAVQGISCA